jgi:hypothetical protein
MVDVEPDDIAILIEVHEQPVRDFTSLHSGRRLQLDVEAVGSG